MSLTMSHDNLPRASRSLGGSIARDGLLALWGRLRHPRAEAYEAWLEERDMVVITATLTRLSERQLNRIGMSHRTLALDVDDLAIRTARERMIARDVLEIIDNGPAPAAIAAE